PSFGGKIYKSVLINFVEEQPYVDYVICFNLIHLKCQEDNAEGTEEVKGSSAVSILVSVPIGEHKIDVITASEDEESRGEEYSCGRKA
ncbi:MAG: hypothetical protein D3922_10825, partial [Candidatus Electrothrix sp. AR1]|nr:hypothetical protein [Candidatus Electrothrix sp. AR1]